MTISLRKDEYASAFEKLFESDDDSDTSYLRMWRQLVTYFSRRGDRTDAEDLASEVIDRLIRKVSDGAWEFKGDRLWAYALGVARNVQREHARRKRQAVAFSSDLRLTEAPQVEFLEVLERERLFEMLEECLWELPSPKRDLLMTYYQFGHRNTEELASALGVSKNNLWVKIHRIRKSLQRKLEHKVKGLNTEVRRGRN